MRRLHAVLVVSVLLCLAGLLPAAAGAHGGTDRHGGGNARLTPTAAGGHGHNGHGSGKRNQNGQGHRHHARP